MQARSTQPREGDRPLIAAPDMTPAALGDLAALHGFLPALAGDHPHLLLQQPVGERALRLALDGPVRVVLEGGADAPLPGPLRAAAADPDRLVLCLFTASAFRINPAMHLCDGLQKRGWLARERRIDVELCVHEALTNAIIHGNLDLQMDDRDDRGYAELLSMMDKRLELAPYRERRITIAVQHRAGAALSVRISDQGGGFDAEGLLSQRRAGGRGLTIMRDLSDELAYEDGGRSLCLEFRP